ncbi:MAG: T9SS type A sorting domain-containing protein [Bacteroides sp.]|nr:T9SS type A sorting domain-containing protein [Bacteroides sp.]
MKRLASLCAVVVAAFCLTGFARGEKPGDIRVSRQDRHMTALNTGVQAIDAPKTVSVTKTLLKADGLGLPADRSAALTDARILSALKTPVAKADGPVLTITSPPANAIFSKTNTPTFELEIANLEEGAVFGTEEGNYLIEVDIMNSYTGMILSAQNIAEKTYTTPALPKDPYLIGFFLGKVVSGRFQAISGVQALTTFTVDYGDVPKDPAFGILNPKEKSGETIDTTYTRTSRPLIQVGIGNTTAKFGGNVGDACLIAMVYNASDYPVLSRPLAYASDSLYLPELPKGAYIVECSLGVMTKSGVDYWKNSCGGYIDDTRVILINYEHPALTMADPAGGTTYRLTRTPTFKLDVTGDNVDFGVGAGKAAIQIVVYDEEDNAVCLFNSDSPEITSPFRLEDGNYTASFILVMQTEEGLDLWPAEGGNSRQITAEAAFTIAYEGAGADPVLTVKNPAGDTTYSETRTPSFELELANGEGITFGGTYSGAPAIVYEVYNRDSLAGNPGAEPVAEGYSLSLTPTVGAPLAKGDYKVVFNLYQIGYGEYFYNWPTTEGEGISASAVFTVNYAEPDPELSMKNPVRDTVYAETNTPSFSVSVANGEKLVWGVEAGNNAVMMQLYTEEAWNAKGDPFVQLFDADTTFTTPRALPQGRYHGVFSLMTVAQEEGYYNNVKNIAGENISADVAFTIAYGTTRDTMLVMKNPARDTVYAETNKPTFEVSVLNGENLVWGEDAGNNMLRIQLFTEEAYAQGGTAGLTDYVPDTVYTLPNALPKGKYYITFQLINMVDESHFRYLTNYFGQINTTAAFTINHGDVRDPAIVLIDPAKDTVYAETTTPTFTVSLDKAGNDITLRHAVGDAAIMVEIYRQGASTSLLEDFITDTTYTIANADALDTGNYKVVFTLMQWVSSTGLNYWPATGNVAAEVNIRVTSTEKPRQLIVPTNTGHRISQDTVWFSWTSKEDRYQLVVFNAAGNAVVNSAVNANTQDTVTTARITGFVDGTYRWQVRAVVTDAELNILDYSQWSATKSFTVKIDRPEGLAVPLDPNTRTSRDTVWFGWSSKESDFELCVMDNTGKEMRSEKVNAKSAQLSGFAEGDYTWKVRAIELRQGAVVDSSAWTTARSFTVKYGSVSVEESILAGVKVYPNPSTGEFRVSVPVDASVDVYAAGGQRVASRKVAAGTEAFTLKASGLYFVRVTADGKTAVRRIVVR